MLQYFMGGYDGVTIVIALFSTLVILLVAFPVHECAHGWMAKMLGDDTAERSGRLTLNPIAHLDLMGTIGMVLFGIGWAKPVPVNPTRCRKVKAKTAMALTAAAGPVSNVLMSLIFMIVLKLVVFMSGGTDMLTFLMYVQEGESPAMHYFAYALYMIIDINLYLAVFNLLPIPPFDGSRLFLAFLPTKWYFGIMKYERYIMLGILLLLWTVILSLPLSFVSNLIFNGLDFITLPINMIFGG